MTTTAASTHRCARGQLVTLTDPRDREANWSGGFKVAEPLPHGEAPRYRLVSSGHAITRTADERKLTVILARNPCYRDGRDLRALDDAALSSAIASRGGYL
jgi:hypothetical protein